MAVVAVRVLQRDGTAGRSGCAGAGLGQHAVGHARVLQVCQVMLGLLLGLRQWLDTWQRGQRGVLVGQQQLAEPVCLQPEGLRARTTGLLESRMHECGRVLSQLLEMAQIGVEDQYVRRGTRRAAMALHAPGELDQRGIDEGSATAQSASQSRLTSHIGLASAMNNCCCSGLASSAARIAGRR